MSCCMILDDRLCCLPIVGLIFEVAKYVAKLFERFEYRGWLEHNDLQSKTYIHPSICMYDSVKGPLVAPSPISR